MALRLTGTEREIEHAPDHQQARLLLAHPGLPFSGRSRWFDSRIVLYVSFLNPAPSYGWRPPTLRQPPAPRIGPCAARQHTGTKLAGPCEVPRYLALFSHW